MSSKPTDSQELKLGPGWTSLSKNISTYPSTVPTTNPTSSRLPNSVNPTVSSSAAPRIAYTKAQLLELYEPGSTAVIPADMAKYPGLTSSEPLVPVNIAPDDHIAHVSALVDTSDPPPGRQRFQSSSPRPGVEAILGRDQRDHPPPSLGLSSSANPSSDPPSSSPPAKKPGQVTSSTRDFWAGSAVLAPAERPAASANTAVERQKLSLKSRSAASDRAASPNGHAPDKSASQQPYWNRATTRGIADSKANWRGGPSGNSSVASGGAKYPGTATEDSATQSIGGSSVSHPASRKSMADSVSSSGGLGRSAFQRDRDGPFFGRSNKEALKPTNTRDLSALASKSSTRETASSSGSLFPDRDSRESKQTSADSHHKAQPEIMADPRKVWYYRDPQGNTQGAFSASQLMEWHKAGYYDEELPVSKNRDHGFKALAVAFGLRKDDSLSRTPPPGFVKDVATTTRKESNANAQVSVARTSREERSRKASKTVEEMAEEVEMMRLQKRKHIQETKAKAGFGAGKESPFFDESSSSTRVVNGHEVLNEGPEESKSEEESATSPSMRRTSDEDVNCDVVAHQTRGDLSLSEADNALKVKSPIAQSRFASFMGQESEEVGNKHAPTSTVHDLEPDAKPELAVSQPKLVTSKDNTAFPDQTDVGALQSLPGEKAEGVHASSAASTAWGAVMMSFQQNQQEQTRHGSKDVPSMPTTSAEQDLMAIDPAIAHASFARPSVNSSSSASSPRVPSSGAELPPWLKFSSSADLVSSAPLPLDQLRDVAVPIHNSSQMQTSLGMHTSLQSQAQLHEHHARVQADLQARAEAAAQMERMRQMQAQAQQVQQAQAQQVQARVAAQRASAIAQAQAQAQAQAHVAQAQAHAQAHAQAQAQAQSQVQAAQPQPQTQIPVQGHSQEQTWILKHQLSQYQHQFDMSYRAHVEATRTLQTARRHAAATPGGTVEQRNYLALAAQAEAAAKEHAINIERIKAAAASVHTKLLQVMAQGQHQQRDLTMQATQQSPQPRGGVSPVSPGQADLSSPHKPNGSVPLSAAKSNLGHVAAPDMEVNGAENITTKEEDMSHGHTSLLDDAYDVMAQSESIGWERVDRNAKPPLVGAPDEKGIIDHIQSVTDDPIEANRSALSEKVPMPKIGLRVTPENSNFKAEPTDPSATISDASERGRPTLIVHSTEKFRSESTPTVAPWSKSVSGPGANNGPSLREIQRQEELRSKSQERETQTTQHDKEESKSATARWNSVQPWGGAGDPSKQRTLSLRDQIKLEEEQKRKKATALSAETGPHSSGPVATKTGWASLVANSKPAVANRGNASVVGKKMDDSTPFWESVASITPNTLSTGGRLQKHMYAQNGQNVVQQRNETLGSSRGALSQTGNQQNEQRPQSPMKSRKAEVREAKGSSEAVLIKGRISNEFANWCTENLQKITGNNNQDTTLVEYLVSIKSPSEIRETVVQNLGASDKARSFADEFIRRLEFERTSIVADTGNGGNSGRKKSRRQRAAKVDPSLVLGFTSTSSSSRIMQGTIETPEMK